MFKEKNFRLLCTEKNNAKTNMAIDELLVKLYDIENLPIFRLYTWEDSFTVGLSQKTSDYEILEKKYKNNCAKRITGGGVLFHGHDISYSLLLPSSLLENFSVKESYEKICQFLLNFYEMIGLKPSFVKDCYNIALSKNEFCQVGYEAYDIIVNGLKIGGNAQKRSKKFIFQHGSVPVKKVIDDKKFGISLEDLNINLTFKDVEKKLIQSFQETFDVNFQNSELTKEELAQLENILKGK